MTVVQPQKGESLMGVQEGEGRKKETDMFETVMTDNFPKLMLSTKPQIQEAQRTPSVINIFKNPHIPRDIIFKLQKRYGKISQKKLEAKSHLNHRETKK